MENWLVSRLQGKRTYLVAGTMALVTVVLVALHRLSPEVAAAVLIMGVSGFGATYRAALERHHAELVSVLMEVGGVGIAVSGRQLPAALRQVETVARDGQQLVAEVCDEAAADAAGKAL